MAHNKNPPKKCWYCIHYEACQSWNIGSLVDTDATNCVNYREPTTQVRTNIFDEEEIHTNCTVQILKNSITGECSVGWWEND